MAEMKFDTKSPLGIVVGLLILGGVLYYQFFMPVYFTAREKRAILDKIKTVRMTKLAEVTQSSVNGYQKNGKVPDVKKLQALNGKVTIEKIESRRGWFGRIKIKVTYSVAGTTPADDGGVIYFSFRARKNRHGRWRQPSIRRITASEYR